MWEQLNLDSEIDFIFLFFLKKLIDYGSQNPIGPVTQVHPPLRPHKELHVMAQQTASGPNHLLHCPRGNQ